MSKYIDAEILYREVDRLMAHYATAEKEMEDDVELSIFYQGKRKMCSEIINHITALQQEQPEANEVEKSWSLQIQAYLTTASDELYAPGKPLYTKEHHEGIHECMKMWQKLHHYYFSTKQEQPEVDLKREAVMFCIDHGINISPRHAEMIARHFFEFII